jgi:hypothetical protein
MNHPYVYCRADEVKSCSGADLQLPRPRPALVCERVRRTDVSRARGSVSARHWASWRGRRVHVKPSDLRCKQKLVSITVPRDGRLMISCRRTWRLRGLSHHHWCAGSLPACPPRRSCAGSAGDQTQGEHTTVPPCVRGADRAPNRRRGTSARQLPMDHATVTLVLAQAGLPRTDPPQCRSQGDPYLRLIL